MIRFPTSKTKAKARLKNMTTAEVSLVDRAANGVDFLVRKSADGLPASLGPAELVAIMRETIDRIAGGELATSDDENAPIPQWLAELIRVAYAPDDDASETHDAVGKSGPIVPQMSLPSQARAELIDATHDALEKFALLVATLRSSTVDDEAVTPAALLDAMRTIGNSLATTADRVAGDPEGQRPAVRPDDGTATSKRSGIVIDDDHRETLDAMRRDMVAVEKQREAERRAQRNASQAGRVPWADDLAAGHALAEVAKRALDRGATIGEEPAVRDRGGNVSRDAQWPDDLSAAVTEGMRRAGR